MITALLSTKLHIPPVRPNCVPRPRLIERLNEGVQRKLTLLSAPAGFGKTTLLGQWARQSPFPVAWVSLDVGDSDPARFWAYVVAALQTVHEGVGEAFLGALLTPQPPAIEELLTGLLNEVAQVPAPFVLILDDFQAVSGQAVHDALVFFLGNLPPQMHLVLSSRADPPLPLARLRARRVVTELRTTDLRFGFQEAALFLNQATKLALSQEDVAALEERTEGWIVGLQMASLAMRARLSNRGRADLSRFIKAFTGSHRFILDFLTEEVLDHQSPDVLAFLLRTSILERLTASLCDAVLGMDDSQRILTHLERANLFLVPLDDERHWYRYHQLFADLLRSRLQQTQAEQIPALHRRAGEWYEGRGQIAGAVAHALQAGDVAWIAHLIAGNALAVIYQGELLTVTRWLDALPDKLLRSRPRLNLTRAWALAYAGQTDGIDGVLQQAELALLSPDEDSQAGPGSDAAEQQITGHIMAIRAYVSALKGDWVHAVDLAREALDRLPEADLTVRGLIAAVLGCSLRSQGDFAGATQAFAKARAFSRAAGNSYLEVDVLWEQAVLHVGQGQLREAMRTCEEALQVAEQYARQSGRKLPVTGYLYSLMGHVLCEWNDLENALRCGREGYELCQRWGQADALAHACYRLATVLLAAGDTAGALEVIPEARRVARDLGTSYIVAAGAHEARVRLAQGDVAAAAHSLQECGLGIDDELKLETSIGHLALAEVLMAEGRLDEALGLLMDLLGVVEAAGAMTPVVRTLVLQALVLQARGEGEQALAALERALTLAEPEGYVRVFVDQGAPMGQLLRQAATRGIRLDYVGRLLAALEGEPAGAGRALRLAAAPWPEPLTERELEVLRLLTTHLSSREIAELLVISVNTARSHIKNIYGKLDVHSRREAVARAQELGLL